MGSQGALALHAFALKLDRALNLSFASDLACATRLFPALDALQLVERDFVRVPPTGAPCLGGRTTSTSLCLNSPGRPSLPLQRCRTAFDFESFGAGCVRSGYRR